MTLKAYVSIRGSRSPRRVDRDASPEYVSYPYAALVFPDLARLPGIATRFELSYQLATDGIHVALTACLNGKPPVVVFRHTLEIPS